MQVKGFGCLHYAMTQSVYFLVPSEGRHNDYFLMACVFLMQPLGMSTLCRDSDCLLYAGTWTVFFVQSPWVIKKTMCLLYDFTQTVYFLMASVYTMMAYCLPYDVTLICLPCEWLPIRLFISISLTCHWPDPTLLSFISGATFQKNSRNLVIGRSCQKDSEFEFRTSCNLML